MGQCLLSYGAGKETHLVFHVRCIEFIIAGVLRSYIYTITCDEMHHFVSGCRLYSWGVSKGRILTLVDPKLYPRWTTTLDFSDYHARLNR